MSSDSEVSRSERLERLRAQLRGDAPSGKAAGRARPSRGSRLLYGVMLHGAARLDAGLELTDLEARMLGPVRDLLSDDEVRDFGRVYREEASAPQAHQVFPDSLIGRPVAQGYSLADLLADLPAVYEDVKAQPNVNVIDLDAPEGGSAHGDAGESEAFHRGLADSGYGSTLVTASAHGAPVSGRWPLQTRLTLSKFFCAKRSTELSGEDEIYWGLSAGADNNVPQSSTTRTYHDVEYNETHQMDANTLLFEGRVNRVLVCHIQCWEEDSKRPSELGRKLAEIARILASAAELMSALPIGGPYEYLHQFIAMVAAVTQLVSEIIGWIEDDFVQERTLAFDRAALVALAARPWGESTGHRFAGSFAEGWFDLYLRAAVTDPLTNDIGLHTRTGTQWNNRVMPWPESKTPDTPALAVHNGNLYCAVRGLDDRVYVSRFQDDRWTAFGQVPGAVTNVAPALVSFQGYLFLGHKNLSADQFLSHSTNGADWTPPAQLPFHAYGAPALTVRNNALHFAAGGDSGQILFRYSSNSRDWSSAATVPNLPPSAAPALATYQGKLYLAARQDGSHYISIIRHDGSNWAASDRFQWTTPSAPALAVIGDTLYCAFRDYDDKIRISTHQGGLSWSDPGTPIAYAVSAPALAEHDNRTYLAFRSPVR
ncbi:hypothetical protein [Streptomyces sp. NPDC051662]|uniref:hypothetical protein n=1 Tax=Streptomyces sp. NPDC051662 TaxID=3154750 RepID=UPI0034446C00